MTPHRRQKILFHVKCFEFKLSNQNPDKTYKIKTIYKVKITYKVINLERVPVSSIGNK